MRLVRKILRSFSEFLYFWGKWNFNNGIFTRSTLSSINVLSGIEFTWNFITNWILTLGYFTLIALIVIEGTTRYTMQRMPIGLEEIALIVAAWVFFIGIALASRDNRQIKVSILYMVPIPNSFHRRLDIAGDIISVLIGGYFSYIATIFCWHTWEHGLTYEPFRIPLVVQIGALAVGMIFMTIYILQRGIRRLRQTGEFRPGALPPKEVTHH